MRIRMVGGYDLFELEDALDSIIQSLRVNGVDQVRAVNFYLALYRNNRRLEFEDQETGAPFKILSYEGRERREYHIVSPRLRPAWDPEEPDSEKEG